MAEFHAVPALALYSSSKKKTIAQRSSYYCSILSLYKELARNRLMKATSMLIKVI